jgi:hypothetical protein
MDTGVLDPVDADQRSGVRGRPPAHARDEPVPARQSPELGAGLVRHGRVLGPPDDRRERPVDVEEDSCLLGLAAQPHEQDRRAHHAGRI